MAGRCRPPLLIFNFQFHRAYAAAHSFPKNKKGHEGTPYFLGARAFVANDDLAIRLLEDRKHFRSAVIVPQRDNAVLIKRLC